MTKTVPGVVLVAVVLVGGYFLLSARRDEPGGPMAFTGEVIEVDRSGPAFDGPVLIAALDASGTRTTIAVPSMGLPFCAAYDSITPAGTIEPGDRVSVVGELDAQGHIVPCGDASHHLTVTSAVRNEALGYEFRYPKGPAGYVVIENEESQNPEFVSGIALVDRSEYEDFLESTEAREGTPSISLRVYRNPRRLSAFVWPLRNPLESNIELAFDEPEEAVVGGGNASRYVADGLYPTDTYVIASGQFIYILACAYLSPESDLYRDFQALVDSFTFIRTADQIGSAPPTLSYSAS